MASPPNPISSWSEYFASTRNKPLHPIYSILDAYLPSSGKALELGAGVGHGVVHLLENGLAVTAVDGEQEAIDIIRERAPQAQTVLSRFEDLELPVAEYDVIVAGFCLFFMGGDALSAFWPKLVHALKPGGLFAGEFLGAEDDWVERGYAWHTVQELREMFSPFEILSWEEANQDGKTSNGTPKHWHVFHLVARLKGH